MAGRLFLFPLAICRRSAHTHAHTHTTRKRSSRGVLELFRTPVPKGRIPAGDNSFHLGLCGTRVLPGRTEKPGWIIYPGGLTPSVVTKKKNKSVSGVKIKAESQCYMFRSPQMSMKSLSWVAAFPPPPSEIAFGALTLSPSERASNHKDSRPE